MTTNYISCSCNCQPHAVDWANNGLVCYGYENAIAIYDPVYRETGKVLQTYHKHSSQVKVIQWIKNNHHHETEILSGSIDGTVILWNMSDGKELKMNHILSLNNSLTTAHAIYLDEASKINEMKSLLICASSMKNTLIIWHCDAVGVINEQQTLNLNERIATDIHIAFFPGSSKIPMIIIATDDSIIHLYACNTKSDDSSMNFIHVKELKGHQDWIRSLDYIQMNKNEALLASGAQDSTIRLWKISPVENTIIMGENDEVTVGTDKFYIHLESVLSGHEHWITGVNWHPLVSKDNDEYPQPLKLLSTALDNTMIIWEPNSNGIWIETVRMGKVGGNSLGYYGCKYNATGTSVLAHGYQGTFHMWQYNGKLNKWLPRSAPSGHFAEVTDLHWEVEGKYLITTSADQTTRIHIPWSENGSQEIWHEIARPQIHGYDINCLAILKSTMFASGADEKVVRIFQAPANFVEYLQSKDKTFPRIIYDRASVPTLGLTNKAIENDYTQDNDEEDHIRGDRPPTEEEIIRQSLWPECEKLYGHGYEIFSMASRHDGKVLATACKSSSAEHSSIILWDTSTWAETQRISGHRLTVTQMKFSPNDKYLLSVSRDRRWALYCCSESDNNDKILYQLNHTSSTNNPLHTRIIWCCEWTADSLYFFTGSRDGKIGIWSINNLNDTEESKHISSIDTNNVSVTALSCSGQFLTKNTYVLAIGFDDGTIQIQKIILGGEKIDTIYCLTLDTSMAHHKTVKKMAFRPQCNTEILELASCSSDRSVKIHQFYARDIVNIKDNV